MPISTTIRRLDSGIYINADGLRCDVNGVPISGGVQTYVLTTDPENTQVGSPGEFAVNTVTKKFFIKETGTSNTGWTQYIIWMLMCFLVVNANAAGVALRWDEFPAETNKMHGAIRTNSWFQPDNGDFSVNLDQQLGLMTALKYSNTISILFLGDSTGHYVARQVPDFFDKYSPFLTDRADFDIQNSFPVWWSRAGNIPGGAGAYVMNFATDSAAWWASYMSLTNSEAIYYGSGNPATAGISGDTIRIVFIGGGSSSSDLKIYRSTAGTLGSYTLSGTITASDYPANELSVTNISVPSGTYYLCISNNTVIGNPYKYGRILYGGIFNSTGKRARISAMASGGKTINDFTSLNRGSVETILTNTKPNVIVWTQIKPISSRSSMATLYEIFTNKCPNADIVFGVTQRTQTGSDYNDPENDTRFQTYFDSNFCRSNNITFVDINSMFDNTNMMKSLDMYQDNIHLRDAPDGLTKIMSSLFITKLQLLEKLAATTNLVLGYNGVGNFTVGGNITVSGTTTATGNASFNGTVTVAGATTLNGATVVNNTFKVDDGSSGAIEMKYPGVPGLGAIYIRGGSVIRANNNANVIQVGNQQVSGSYIYFYGNDLGDGFSGAKWNMFPSGCINIFPAGGGGHHTDDAGQGSLIVNGPMTNWNASAVTRFVGGAVIGSAKFTSGTGTPEGVVTGNVGDIFMRTDGGATTTLYVKTSGTGNTGWTAK